MQENNKEGELSTALSNLNDSISNLKNEAFNPIDHPTYPYSSNIFSKDVDHYGKPTIYKLLKTNKNALISINDIKNILKTISSFMFYFNDDQSLKYVFSPPPYMALRRPYPNSAYPTWINTKAKADLAKTSLLAYLKKVDDESKKIIDAS